MDARALHEDLPALVPAVLASDPDARVQVEQVEAHVAAGCSRCARALVNAQDVMVSVAQAAPGASPGAGLRERILARAGVVRAGAPAAGRGQAPRRFFDPAGEVARLHARGPDDAERVLEIDALGVGTPLEDDRCGDLLAQLQRLVGYPLLFVSVVRGERVGYRAQRGLEGGGRDRRRETSFCTHTVSTGEPMVVPDAGTEPFFRGSSMVLRDGVRAYVGVPLRSSRGIIVGTLCAMDYTPRPIGPSTVRTLERFADLVMAEIERARPTSPS